MSEIEHEDPEVTGLMGAPPDEQAAWLRAHGLPAAGLLFMMSACENRCFFCANPGVIDPPPEMITPWPRVAAFLEAGRELKLSTLCVGGTEPATHPHFERALALASNCGFRHIQLMTSGTRLAETDVAARWYGLGVRSIAVPLYGTQAPEHDAIIGRAGFEQLLAGLDQAQEAGIELHLHTLALRRLLPRIAEIARFARERWSVTLAVGPVRPKEQLFDFDSEGASYEHSATALQDAAVSLVGFPDCVAADKPRAAALIVQLYFLGQRRTLLPICDGCARAATCPGVLWTYRDRPTAVVLRPFAPPSPPPATPPSAAPPATPPPATPPPATPPPPPPGGAGETPSGGDNEAG